MEKLKIIDLNQKEIWKNIADDSMEVYDKWQYVSAFQRNGDGIANMAYLQGKNGIIFNVFMKRDILQDIEFQHFDIKNELFDIITPYGYGGVKIKGKISEEERSCFFEEFKKYCIKNNIVSEFIRLNPLEENHKNYENENYEIQQISKTIFIKLENEEQIWNDLKSTCRNRIRKAINHKLVVRSGFDNKMFKEFQTIYQETMERDKAEKYYFFQETFFEDIRINLAHNAMIYTVYLEEKPIDSILVICSGDKAHYHLGGTLSDYMDLGAHNLVLYKAALDMLRKGYKRFHLGGGYGGDQSPLLRFKKTLNKNGELDFYIGKKIYCEEFYNKLCDWKNVDRDSNFFPLYRTKKGEK